MQATKQIYHRSGFIGFYRGIASPLTALTILNTVNFSTYESFRRLFSRFHDSSSISKNHMPIDGNINIMLSGLCVGPIAALFSTPFELVKTQMQLDGKRMQANQEVANTKNRLTYRSSLHVAYIIISKYGLGALYRGHAVNTLREIIFLGTYFTVYENLRATLPRLLQSSSSDRISVPLAGGLSGAIGWLLSFPLDCAKANIQGQHLDLSGKRVRGIVVIQSLIATKGVVGLYAGVGPSIARAFLVSSTRFSAYESVQWILTE